MADERRADTARPERRAMAAAERALTDAEATLLAADVGWLDGAEQDERDLQFAADVLERLPDVWAGAAPEARDALAGSIWPAG